MRRFTKLIRPLILAGVVASMAGCGSTDEDWSYYPNHYPWYYTDYGAYTVVRRPIRVIDRWTTRALRYDPYRGYALSRHNSPVIVHTATSTDATLEVRLTPQKDYTNVEVRARNGGKQWDKERAKVLLGQILHDYR